MRLVKHWPFRPSGETASKRGVPRSSRQIYWMLGTLLFCIIAIFLYTNRRLLRSAVPVSVERAVAGRVSAGEMQSVSDGQVLFQASGWIEPDPYMTRASSFVEGLVSEVHVLNGQSVKKGDALAKIDDRNLRLAVAASEAGLKALQRELAVAVERRKLAAKEASLAEKKLSTTQAELSRLALTADVMRRSGDTVPFLHREDARLARDRQEKAVQEVMAEIDARQSGVSVMQAEEDVVRRRIENHQAVLSKLQLDLERSTIRSPLDGIVQKVYARVGNKVMLAGDSMDSPTIADLYDPLKLQVRVDVALADAGGLEVGMPTQVATDILPGVQLKGKVTSIVGQADLAKNTLQAKVQLLEPSLKLRPEMLARVEFMPLPSKAKDKEDAQASTIQQALVHAYIPEKALGKISGQQTDVWVVNGEKEIAEKRSIKLGSKKIEGWREVVDGINPGDLVIVSDPSPLAPGTRIRIASPKTEHP